MWDVGLLLSGMVLAALGGEVFIRGAVGLAARLRVPPGIIGATIAAFATSAPEMAVGINAALAGASQVAAGDALGSNVVNLGLVLGAVVLIAPLRLEARAVLRDLPLTAGAPLLLGLLAADGRVSRVDAGALIVVFAVWLTTTVLQAFRERDGASPLRGEPGIGQAMLLVTAGAALLAIAGRLVVLGALAVGQRLGLDAFFVGATLVALGTSMPELATALLARLRGHADLGAGTVMGSNIFNTLWIVGVAALIQPFDVRAAELSVAVAAGAVGALLLFPAGSWVIGRLRGALLLGGYALYVGVLFAVH